MDGESGEVGARWLLLAAIGIGLALRVRGLNEVPLVYDEVTRAILCTRPLFALPGELSATHHSFHP